MNNFWKDNARHEKSRWGGVNKRDLNAGHNEVPNNFAHKVGHNPNDLFRINPSPHRNVSMRTKKQKSYPFFSYIQELQDTIQSLFASGTSLSSTKTMDFTESQFRMLPLTAGTKLIAMGALLTLLFYFCNLLAYILSTSATDYFVAIGHWISVVFFTIYLCFHKYIISSMRQFVIIDEKIPKTSRFFNIIRGAWGAVEIVLVGGFIVLACILLFSKFFYPFFHHFFQFFNKILPFIEVNTRDFFVACFNVEVSVVVVLGFYAITTIISNKKFIKMQLENNANLYSMIDPDRAMDIVASSNINSKRVD